MLAVVDVTAEMDTSAGPDALFAWVEDLALYPEWLGLVSRAEFADGHPDDEGPAWSIDLRARLGPLARAKRLRMVRTVHDAPRRVTFERREHDGREHSAWVLRAEVAERADGTRLVMHLHYGGGLFGPVVGKLLRDEIDRSRPRLAALVAASPR
jgi:Polyketide cyclase / dehydrase and lipid transport